MRATLLRLAETRFGTLTAADREFFTRVAEGPPADLTTTSSGQEGPVTARQCPARDVLAADRIVWLCQDAEASAGVPATGIQVAGVKIDGDLNLRHVVISFPLIFKKCVLTGTLDVAGSNLRILDLSGSEVHSIDGTGATIDNGIFFCDGFHAQGRVCLEYATTAGRLDCTAGCFDGGWDQDRDRLVAIDGDGLQVRGDVLLHEGFRAEGMVSLVGARIDGNLECNHAVFHSPGGVALDVERARVDGNVFLCHGSWSRRSAPGEGPFTAEGEVKLVRATIGGDLNCMGAEFCNPGESSATADTSADLCAISARGLRITGSVFMSEGFRALGMVHLLGARVGGNLEFNGGAFLNRNAVALDAERVLVTGDVFLCSRWWQTPKPRQECPFRVEGNINLIGAQIGGTVDFGGACFGGDRAPSSSDISLLAATIKRELVWKNIVSPKAVVLDLRMARVGKLTDDTSSCRRKDNLRLDGFVYDQLEDRPEDSVDRSARTNLELRIEWLRRQEDFHHQPYEQLAAFYRRQGQEREATRVLIAKAEDPARLARMGLLEKGWHTFLGLTIRYGYRPSRALAIAAVFVLFGTVVFQVGHASNMINETRLIEHVAADGSKTTPIPGVRKGYPQFNPLVYSLDMLIPLVDLHQASYWLPSEAQPEKVEEATATRGVTVLRVYMWGHIVAGWILTSLLIAGLSGLVKR